MYASASFPRLDAATRLIDQPIIEPLCDETMKGKRLQLSRPMRA